MGRKKYFIVIIHEDCSTGGASCPCCLAVGQWTFQRKLYQFSDTLHLTAWVMRHGVWLLSSDTQIVKAQIWGRTCHIMSNNVVMITEPVYVAPINIALFLYPLYRGAPSIIAGLSR